MKRARRWWEKRTVEDAPTEFDQATTMAGAWAEGYNAAVQEYIDEVDVAVREWYRS